MGFLTRYGTYWGALPMTSGNIFFVAPSDTYRVGAQSYGADNGQDGLSPERAVRTVAQAVSNATANNGDVICLLPGTHTVATASVAASKAGLTFMGLPYYPDQIIRTRGAGAFNRPPAILTTNIATDQIMNVTAADVALVNLTIRPITAAAAIDFTTAAHRFSVRDCYIDMITPAGHANTAGIVATSAAQAPTFISFLGCTIAEDNAGTSCSYAINVGAAAPFLISDCNVFKDGNTAGSVAWTAAVKINDACWGHVRDCDIWQCTQTGAIAGGSISTFIEGVDMTNLESINISGCRKAVSVTKLAGSFGAGDVSLNLNYTATVAGGAGGTLVTATA